MVTAESKYTLFSLNIINSASFSWCIRRQNFRERDGEGWVRVCCIISHKGLTTLIQNKTYVKIYEIILQSRSFPYIVYIKSCVDTDQFRIGPHYSLVVVHCKYTGSYSGRGTINTHPCFKDKSIYSCIQKFYEV